MSDRCKLPSHKDMRRTAAMRASSDSHLSPNNKQTPSASGGSSTGMSPYLDMSGASSDQATPESLPEAFAFASLPVELGAGGSTYLQQNMKPNLEPAIWSFEMDAATTGLGVAHNWQDGAMYG